MRQMNEIERQSVFIRMIQLGADGAAFMYRYENQDYSIIASYGGDWDHVSVSSKNRTPSWNVMANIKDIFFEPEEVAMQLHPAQSDYVNFDEHCLHIWRPQHSSIPLPPVDMV
ncbi:hypothetical protein C1940_08835 [Lactiplantibacillus plantarum subsp. plantarum]|uniref:DUF7694 domain-containing protein n=1 Tax=Lactiplantibacillus plantarum TaxID=1590 RepID=UPI000CD379C0|nr:hypothetical protein [Lactiplantibacillus plantarum]AUV72564.1 hypothetical protein C1940_08835 [Lactiplantibacillus plantarum subsp. plantarum]